MSHNDSRRLAYRVAYWLYRLCIEAKKKNGERFCSSLSFFIVASGITFLIASQPSGAVMVAFLQSRFYIYFVLSAFTHTIVDGSRLVYSEV